MSGFFFSSLTVPSACEPRSRSPVLLLSFPSCPGRFSWSPLTLTATSISTCRDRNSPAALGVRADQSAGSQPHSPDDESDDDIGCLRREGRTAHFGKPLRQRVTFSSPLSRAVALVATAVTSTATVSSYLFPNPARQGFAATRRDLRRSVPNPLDLQSSLLERTSPHRAAALLAIVLAVRHRHSTTAANSRLFLHRPFPPRGASALNAQQRHPAKFGRRQAPEGCFC